MKGDDNMSLTKSEIASFVNRNCTRASCFMCAEGEKYADYTQCPYLQLKQISRDRKITEDDIPDNLVK